MLAIDTNILIRYLTGDDSSQSKVVEKFFRRCESEAERIYLSIPVICETVWVLRSRYKAARAEVVAVFEQLLEREIFVIDREVLIKHCLEQYRRGPAGFVDYVVGALAEEAGCSDTLTFDRSLKGVRRYSILA